MNKIIIALKLLSENFFYLYSRVDTTNYEDVYDNYNEYYITLISYLEKLTHSQLTSEDETALDDLIDEIEETIDDLKCW